MAKGKNISSPENLSIEEQEMQLRIERAEKTAFQIKARDKNHFPFTTYEVVGATKVHYTVEIRSLDEKINSCSCPDYKINTLGSCKHIEGVLNFLKKRRIPKMESSRAEIFLSPSTGEARVWWPKNESFVRAWLSPYLSTHQMSLTDPVMGAAALERALKEAPSEITSCIRMSEHLLEWTKDRQLIQRRENDKREFLADVRAGKRSLQMLTCNLFPYQEEGMLHLAFQGRAILADEMGLGKTIQAIGACELLRRLNRVKHVVIITPASLKGEWEEQIAKFIGLPTLIVAGSRPQRLACYKKESFFYLINYEQVRTDYEEIQALINPDIMILDEAQRAKNWQTKTAWAVKQLKTPYAFALTGTPLENRIDELFSIMQIIDPQILGPLFKFQQEFYGLNDKGKPVKYKNLEELHQRLRSVLLRRRKKDVEEQLPERTISQRFVKMEPEQRLRYDEYSERVAKLIHILKRRPLTADELKKLQQFLACMRMIADTPYILDKECKICPKLEELEEILTNLLQESDAKIIIFSEWERMLFLVRELAEKLGINFAWHTGSVPQLKRREDIRRFKEDPHCRLFLTTDSGSTGLNLQVANIVINLDLPWNPAKLEQRIARAWRKNQSRVVQVINLITEDSIEHRMLSILAMKQAVADAVLDNINNIDEMPIPSASRAGFIEKLEELTGWSEPAAKTSPEEFKQDILARYSDRIHLLEQHANLLFAVVDKTDETIQQTFSQSSTNPVEVLDLETYMTLKKLAAAGIIHFGTGEKTILFQSQLVQVDTQELARKKLHLAQSYFKEADRKLKMALLLKSGGFSLEALPAASEAFHKAVEVLKALEQTPDTTTLGLQQQFTEGHNPESLIDTLAAWMENIPSKIAEHALGV